MTAQTEPFGYHLFRHSAAVQQIFGVLSVGADLFLVELMTEHGFVVACIAFLYAPHFLIVDNTHSFYGVVVVFVWYRKRVKGFVDLFAELVFRVIDKHGGKRVSTVRELFLRVQCKNRKVKNESRQDEEPYPTFTFQA